MKPIIIEGEPSREFYNHGINTGGDKVRHSELSVLYGLSKGGNPGIGFYVADDEEKLNFRKVE